MMNPFDDASADFRVLVNDLQQHSLWPTFARVPDGWTVMFGPGSREACLDFIEQNWADITPRRFSEVAS